MFEIFVVGPDLSFDSFSQQFGVHENPRGRDHLNRVYQRVAGRSLVNGIVIVPLLVTVNVLSTALNSAPAAAKMSNLERTVVPLIATLNTRLPWPTRRAPQI